MAYLSRAKRLDQIIFGATKFFAENGLSGQTRRLSVALGIAQPLLYRYFPSKEALIKRICSEAFTNRWSKSWPALIGNNDIPVLDRYKQFYREYNEIILTREWVRLLMHAELNNFAYGKEVIQRIREEIFTPLSNELRKFYGFPSINSHPMTKEEFELLLEFHGMVYYNAVRRHVYQLKFVMKIEPLVDNMAFLVDQAYPRLLGSLFPDHTPKPRPGGAKKS